MQLRAHPACGLWLSVQGSQVAKQGMTENARASGWTHGGQFQPGQDNGHVVCFCSSSHRRKSGISLHKAHISFSESPKLVVGKSDALPFLVEIINQDKQAESRGLGAEDTGLARRSRAAGGQRCGVG